MKHLYTTVLSIAGSDSSAGAGIQADIKTALIAGVHLLTAVTAVTAQNSSSVKMIEPVSPDTLAAQIQAVADDITIDAVKIGMLPDPRLAKVVARCIEHYGWQRIVVDPIGAPTLAGSRPSLMHEAALAVRELVLPKATLVTPNLNEGEWLSGKRADRHNLVQSMAEMAQDIASAYRCRAVLLKGGHSGADDVTDTLFDSHDGAVQLFFSNKIETRNSHGTGCCLSTAIACGLARRQGLVKSIGYAERLIHNLLDNGKGYSFGKGGYGPLGFIDTIKK